MKKTVALLVVLFAVALGTVSCDTAANPKNVARSNSVEMTGVINYGNNIYYFPRTGANFGNELSLFLDTHRNLEVSAMAGNGYSAYGVTRGYFVTFRPKSQPQK